MKSKLTIVVGVFVLSVVLFLLAGVPLFARNQVRIASLKGKVFRSDTHQGIPNASILLMDEKRSDKQDNSVEAKTDEMGNYNISNVPAGKYTLSIRAWYKTQEEAPCQLLMGKTNEKDSTVMVTADKDKFMEQVSIKNFSIKAGKDTVKDFDFVCSSMFSK